MTKCSGARTQKAEFKKEPRVGVRVPTHPIVKITSQRNKRISSISTDAKVPRPLESSLAMQAVIIMKPGDSQESLVKRGVPLTQLPECACVFGGGEGIRR